MWQADLGNGKYRNPILYADYSDPDAIRVGEDYFMIASSFCNAPGLPILHSKDLVNWKVVNYALDELPEFRYRNPIHGCGVWAPAIRYHEGTYYICFPMPDEGIYMTTTKDPFGKWSKPVNIRPGAGWIDPCPFWDDDGKAYLVAGVAKSRIGYKSVLHMVEMQPDGMGLIGEEVKIFDGNENDQVTIEGPKMYKRNGWYYVFAPAGGVKTGWQVILRSKNIYGPYEEKNVLHQGNSIVNGPHQGALVDTVNGDEWFLHFQDRGLYGRIVHMQPVVWENDWPVMGINAVDGCGEPCIIHKKPNTGITEKPCYLAAGDDFSSEKLGLQWQWIGNPKDDFYSLKERKGFLRLYCKNPSGKAEPILWECSNVLTEKLVCPYFEASACVNISALSEQEQAGMVMMGGHYAYLAVRVIRGQKRLILGKSYDSEDGMREKAEQLLVLPEGQEQVYLIFAMREGDNGSVFHCYYSLTDDTDSASWTEVRAEFTPSDHTWVGAKIGLFANVIGEKELGGYGDFEYLHVEALED